MTAPAPLNIDGTIGSDTIEVYAALNSATEVMVNLNGTVSGPFCPEGPIRIRGLAGADTIRVRQDVYLPTEIDGGPGADTLDGGSGNDVFLVRDYEMDLVRGGLGMDQAATDSSDEPTQIETINPAIPGVVTAPLRVKILVVNYDPIVPNEGNRRLYEIFGWPNPRTSAEGYKADVERASGGAVQFEIVEWRDVNEIPVFDNGFQYTPNAYVQARRANSGYNTGRADFPRMVADQGIVPLINAGSVDEVWFFGDHYFHLPGESWMSGPDAYTINGPVYSQIPTTRPFASMGFSYERGTAEMIHNLGHRTEATMNRIYGGWNLANPTSNWDRFSANVTESNGAAGVGTTHFPANASEGYDTFNPRTVQSWADDYLNYPNLTFQTRSVNRGSWAKGPNPDYERSYQNWYFSHLPRAAGTNADGKLNNWWEYVFAFDQYTPTGLPKSVNVTAFADDVVVNNKQYHIFPVRYSGADAIRVSSLGNGDVIVFGPNGFQGVAEMVRRNESSETSRSIVVTYRVAAPGRSWDVGDVGGYEIRLRANEVLSGTGQPIPSTTIGAFQMRSNEPAELPNDSKTLLLLRLNGSTNGENGEPPITFPQLTYVQGKLGLGALFSSGTHARYPIADNIDSNMGTIEFWIKPNWDADGTSRTFVEAGNRFNNGILVAIDGLNNLRFIQWGDNPQTPQIESSYERGVAIGASDWKRDQWHHLAVTWNQSAQSIAFYLDGQLRSSDSGVRMANFSTSDFIMGARAGGSQPSDATFDEFRISSRARTTNEVAESFEAGFGLNDLRMGAATTGIVGQRSQTRAFFRLSEDIDFDVTQQVNWTSSNPNVATISPDGEIEFRTSGTVMITATLGGISKSIQIGVSQENGPKIESVGFDPLSPVPAQTSLQVTLRFAAANQPVQATLGRGDVLIRGPRGFVQFPEFIDASTDPASGQMVAKYRITPPGGYWDLVDNGDYVLDVVSHQIVDTDGDFLLSELGIATFPLRIKTMFVPIVASANASTPERAINQSLVWSMLATNSITGQPAIVNWSIASGNDGDLFEIHQNTGEVRVANASRIDFPRKREYTLLVRATDRNDPTNYGEGALKIRINSRFFNATKPLDVDADRTVSPLDVLEIINYINRGEPSVPPASVSSPPFLDTDNDGTVSPLDVLVVINGINQGTGNGEGEKMAGLDGHELYKVFSEPGAFWMDNLGFETSESIARTRRKKR